MVDLKIRLSGIPEGRFSWCAEHDRQLGGARWTLLRRSQKHRLIWTPMHRLAERWVPKPRPLHPYPERRSARNISADGSDISGNVKHRKCSISWNNGSDVDFGR